jgi:tetratricopeptide (TPR) repeat protein
MKKPVLNATKLGASLGAAALTTFIDPSGFTGLTKIVHDIATAVAPNFVHQYLSNYDPEELLNYLNGSHELNHDIEKLMTASVPGALMLLKKKFLAEHSYDHAAIEAVFKSLINDANIRPPKTTDQHNMLEDRDAWLGDITNYLFLGRDTNDELLIQLRSFFEANFPDCFKLVFTEGMKNPDDEKPLKAFLIKSLEGLTRQSVENQAMQAVLLAEIKALKNDQTAPSLSVARSYFESEFERVHEKLGKIHDLVLGIDQTIKKVADRQETAQQTLDRIENKISPLIPKHLTKLPFKANYFIGREADLETIEEQFGNHNVLLMNGEGGIGKTTLAAHYYQNQQANYQHLAWVLAEGGIQTALLAALSGPLQLTFGEQELEAQRFEKLMAKMATLQTPSLLVLDNANDLPDLEKTLFELKSSNFRTLLTTRVNQFDDWQFLKIDALPETKAVALFCHHAKPEAGANTPFSEEELKTLKAILEAIGYNTLVLTLLAKNYRERNRITLKKYHLSDLLHELRTQGLLKVPKTRQVSSDYGHRYGLAKAEPEVIISAMYDLRPLSPEELYLLTNLAVLPPEQIPHAQLGDLLQIDETYEAVIDDLYRKGWIDLNETNNMALKISPVVQAVMLRKNEGRILETCEKLITYLTTQFKTLNHTAVQPYAEMTRHVVDTLKIDDDTIAFLSLKLADFYRETGNLELARSFIDKSFFIYQQTDNQYNCAVCLERLGSIHQALGKIDLALDFFQKYNQLREELYRDNPKNESLKNGLAISYEKLGSIHQALGKTDQALDFFQKETDLFEELYRDNPKNESLKNGLAISYSKLGSIHQALGKTDQALDFFQKDLQVTEELYRDNPKNESLKNNLAISYSKLGSIHQDLGKADQALDFFQKVTGLFEELYRDNPKNESLKNGLAISYSKLGSIHQALGKTDQALDFFQKDLQVTEELYRDNPKNVNLVYGLATSYIWIGWQYEESGIPDKAQIYYQKALPLLENLYQSTPIQQYLRQLNWVKAALERV